jgi:DNA-binding Xre family transcriptional regulator
LTAAIGSSSTLTLETTEGNMNSLNDILAPLSETAVRDIIRNAEGKLVPGGNVKAAVVDAALDHLTVEISAFLRSHAGDDIEMAEMMGEDVQAAMVESLTPLGVATDCITPGATLDGVASAIVDRLRPLPMNTGKWLAKLGIVASHLDAVQPGASAQAEPAAPPSAAPPPPELLDLSTAFIAMREATTIEDADLSKRLGISRSSLHNYLSGRTKRIKLTQAQALVLVADIDVRVSELRRAATIFAGVKDQ